MWLGERITDKGIGNGISMLIMIGIVSRFPAAIYQEAFENKGLNGALLFIIELLVLFFIVVGSDCPYTGNTPHPGSVREASSWKQVVMVASAISYH